VDFNKVVASIVELEERKWIDTKFSLASSAPIAATDVRQNLAWEAKTSTEEVVKNNKKQQVQKSRPARLEEQLEVLADWSGKAADGKPAWKIRGWIPIDDSTLTDARRKQIVDAFLAQPEDKRTVVKLAYQYDGASLPLHTPLSPADQKALRDLYEERTILHEALKENENMQAKKEAEELALRKKKAQAYRNKGIDDADSEEEEELEGGSFSESDSDVEGFSDLELEGGGASRFTRSKGGELPKPTDDPDNLLKRRPGATSHYPYVLNIMDIFSKYAWSFPLRDQTSRSVTKILSELWLREGAPAKLQSDGGFKSDELKHLADRFNVRLERCAPYHSQCSGAIERLNRTIRESVRNMKHVYGHTLKGGKWANFLPAIVSSYNAQKHSTTGLSPFHVQRGFAPRPQKPLHFIARDAQKAVELNPLVEVDHVPANKILHGGSGGGGEACAVEGGAKNREPSAREQKEIEAGLAASRIAKLVHEHFDDDSSQPPKPGAASEKELVESYMRQNARAAEERNEFVSKGIRHGALGMMTDALIKAEASMKRLEVGALVRVSLQHLSKTVRSEVKVGMKRAQDLKTWSSTVFCVVQQPIETWLGAEDSKDKPSSQDSRVSRPADGGRAFRTLYTVVPCLADADEVLKHDPLFVPRQDLLLVSKTQLSAQQVTALKRGDTHRSIEGVVRSLVGLRDAIPAFETFQ
jgi:hypothetical protein